MPLGTNETSQSEGNSSTNRKENNTNYTINENTYLIGSSISTSNTTNNMTTYNPNDNNTTADGSSSASYYQTLNSTATTTTNDVVTTSFPGPHNQHHHSSPQRATSIAMHRPVDMEQLPFLLENNEILTLLQSDNDDNTSSDNENEANTESSSFIQDFMKSNGPPQVVMLICLLAIGFGSVIGVVPAVMMDRYARTNHGYDDPRDCSTFVVKPEQCLQGSADAQNAAAVENLVSNIFTFVTSSLLGSISDMYGRRNILIIAMMVCTLQPLALVLIQVYPTMSPVWFYTASAISGLFNWMAIALSSMSDVMPKKWRAPSFGLLMAGFLVGLAFAPQLALALGHYKVSVLSLGTVIGGLVIAVVFLPETLSKESAAAARELDAARVAHFETTQEKIIWYLYRPVWELSILNRNRLFRLLTALAFFSSFVSAGDQTLVIYYIEERLGFNDGDVANFFLLLGLLGIVIQGVVLKHLNEFFGERRLLVIAFCIGTLHNALYGCATNKTTIFVAGAVGTLGMTAFPTISAIKANNVESSEQGRIQGALYSVTAVASAIGPIVLRFVYHYTKDGFWMGPGSMFLVAAAVNALAVYCAYLLPMEANSTKREGTGPTTETTNLVDDDEFNTETCYSSNASSPLI